MESERECAGSGNRVGGESERQFGQPRGGVMVHENGVVSRGGVVEVGVMKWIVGVGEREELVEGGRRRALMGGL